MSKRKILQLVEEPNNQLVPYDGSKLNDTEKRRMDVLYSALQWSSAKLKDLCPHTNKRRAIEIDQILEISQETNSKFVMETLCRFLENKHIHDSGGRGRKRILNEDIIEDIQIFIDAREGVFKLSEIIVHLELDTRERALSNFLRDKMKVECFKKIRGVQLNKAHKRERLQYARTRMAWNFG
eukprot:NODE_223_length_12360_cov_0.266862.p5 type:complete len:182 gc:universal NODE_223_length_12360_cov_0.266862:10237-10782(+)